MKVIGSRSRSQEQKCRKFLFPQCKTSIEVLHCGNRNFLKIQPRGVCVSCGFRTRADRMVWPPSLSRDRTWRRVTKCTHSWAIDVKLDWKQSHHTYAISALSWRRQVVECRGIVRELVSNFSDPAGMLRKSYGGLNQLDISERSAMSARQVCNRSGRVVTLFAKYKHIHNRCMQN